MSTNTKTTQLGGFCYTESMTPAKVLIIEDSTYLADSLIDMLGMHDHAAIHAKTGYQGLAAAAEHEPDLILLDIRLPDISGYEVYKKLRQTDWGETAKVLVLTASESIENIALNIDLPQERILFKPQWSMSDLLTRIEKEVHSN